MYLVWTLGTRARYGRCGTSNIEPGAAEAAVGRV